MKRYPCEETTLDFLHGPLRIRLWVTNEGGLYDPRVMWKDIQDILHAPPYGQHIIGPVAERCQLVAERIALSNLPNLAAVQVIDEVASDPVGVRTGHMIYTVGFD